MLSAVIIDDEEGNRNRLNALLQGQCEGISILGLARDGFEGIKLIREKKPDFILLDIQMPKMDGFQMLETCGEFDFDVVFVTAFDQYAIKAIKFSAFDFLLKPVDVDELKTTINRLRLRNSKIDSQIKNRQLMSNLRQQSKKITKITLHSHDGVHIIPVENIIYLEADGQYTHFHLKDDLKKLSSLNLLEYEDLLCDQHFFRAHRSYIINMNEIRKYVKGEGGSVIMSNGHEVDISKRRKSDFLKVLENS
jgi:two-component system LytT family response regulator